MALLPDRYPNRDFFVLDIADVVPKDDTASMEHPLFSLATNPDMREIRYANGNVELRIVPSGVGLPTIFDKDILIFCVSQLMHRKNQGLPIGKIVRFSAHELMVATNRTIGGEHYERLEEAFLRLRGTQFVTNIKTGGKITTSIFGMVDRGGFVRTDDDRPRLEYCELTLSDWMMRAIEAAEVVTISPAYFRLRRPLERRLYEIARKHCGSQKRWQIGLEKLQLKTGSNAQLKRFRFNLRQIIEDDATPDYTMELTDTDQVIFRPRRIKNAAIANQANVGIPFWAEEKGREIARIKGWDFYALIREFEDFSRKGGVKDLGAAFVGFCRKKPSLR